MEDQSIIMQNNNEDEILFYEKKSDFQLGLQLNPCYKGNSNGFKGHYPLLISSNPVN